MKTKQEVIKQAYGEYWEQVKYYVDDNGWVDTKYLSLDETNINYQQSKDRLNFKVRFCHRPSSLKRIENNAGWHKIESESDLPKDYCSCWCIVDEVVINTPLNFNPITKQFHDNAVFQEYKWFSHYQIITKPLNHLY